MLDYLVLYTSKTGNTKQIAMEIFSALPGTSKDIVNLSEISDIPALLSSKQASLYFIGFWTNCGSCSMEIMDVLSLLHNNKIAIFGTCGMGNDTTYYHSVSSKVSAFISEDCECLGIFMCQGKMPITVRRRYESVLAEAPENENTKRMIRNFDEALLHPDFKDLEGARNFVGHILVH